MQHSIILRAAWALTISLVVVATAFAWSANQRERQAAAAAAAAAATPAVTEAGPGAIVDPAARRSAVVEAWEKRCAKCHDSVEIPEWLATQQGDKVSALETFLRQHGKSSAEETGLLAEWFGTGATL